MNLYVKTSKDRFELPEAVAASPAELAEITGATSNTIRSAIGHGRRGWYKIELEEEPEKVTRICMNCGEAFEDDAIKRPRKFCSVACRSENRKRINAWKSKLKKAEEKEKKEKDRQKRMTLAEAQEEARKAGLSYGQYMALQDAKKIKVQRRSKNDGKSAL